MYDFATAPFRISLYMRKIFFFISVYSPFLLTGTHSLPYSLAYSPTHTFTDSPDERDGLTRVAHCRLASRCCISSSFLSILSYRCREHAVSTPRYSESWTKYLQIS
jgi:hypothetical protein